MISWKLQIFGLGIALGGILVMLDANNEPQTQNFIKKNLTLLKNSDRAVAATKTQSTQEIKVQVLSQTMQR